MGRPLVFAHRGASAALPEHTLAAYLQALADGADGLECDVRLTRDGHLVCVHDRRLERTSNGRGRVSAHTLAELDRLDFGSWFYGADPASSGGAAPTSYGGAAPTSYGGAAPSQAAPAPPHAVPAPSHAAPARLLTLDRLLRAVRAADRPVRLLVETKHPARHGHLLERRLVALLRRHGLADPAPGVPRFTRPPPPTDLPGPAGPAHSTPAQEPLVKVTVMSFSPLALRRVRQLAPDLPTVLLLMQLPPGLRPRRLPFGIRIAGPGIDLVRSRPDLVPTLRAAGNQVYVWTVNDPVDLELVRRYEVDGVITDNPAATLAALWTSP